MLFQLPNIKRIRKNSKPSPRSTQPPERRIKKLNVTCPNVGHLNSKEETSTGPVSRSVVGFHLSPVLTFLPVQKRRAFNASTQSNFAVRIEGRSTASLRPTFWNPRIERPYHVSRSDVVSRHESRLPRSPSSYDLSQNRPGFNVAPRPDLTVIPTDIENLPYKSTKVVWPAVPGGGGGGGAAFFF
ncbi:hypothetical protein GOBAR_DD31426 [Gossypium barbadense]|nr:hypothetical protein GOBAR_DD31426 [Gossypium barbadense]